MHATARGEVRRPGRYMRLFLTALIALSAPGALADPEAAAGEEGGMSLEEIARMMDNPLGNLWIIFLEGDFARYRGKPASGGKNINTYMVQPILPVPLTEDWNLVTRPIIPIVSAPKFELNLAGIPDGAFGDCPGNCNSGGFGGIPPGISLTSDREVELADIMVWSMLSPAEPTVLPDGSKFVWGLGPSFRLPTASEDQFGSEKFSMGPSSVTMRLPAEDGRWTFGLFNQHHFSVGGTSNRSRVRSSQFQYIWYYKLPVEGQWSLGAAPMVNVNWDAKVDDKLSFPLGIGLSSTFFLGPMPLRIGVEYNGYVVKPESYGPRHMLKVYLVPVLPRLVKEPIFGS